jgi:hypothetical protein
MPGQLSYLKHPLNVIRDPVLLSALAPIKLMANSHMDLTQGFKG